MGRRLAVERLGCIRAENRSVFYLFTAERVTRSGLLCAERGKACRLSPHPFLR